MPLPPFDCDHEVIGVNESVGEDVGDFFGSPMSVEDLMPSGMFLLCEI